MTWRVELHGVFHEELIRLEAAVRVAILANMRLLEGFGPRLGRPQVDTLAGSRYSNMKEIRITVPGGEWRVAFAFDPERAAILLVAGSKSGVSEKLFHRRLIHDADSRYAEHLRSLESNPGRKS